MALLLLKQYWLNVNAQYNNNNYMIENDFLSSGDMSSDFIVLHDFPNGSFSKKPTLPWKTELFRNTLQVQALPSLM